LIRGKDQLFKCETAFVAFIFVNRHLTSPITSLHNLAAWEFFSI
jgi:hypothetical protein